MSNVQSFCVTSGFGVAAFGVVALGVVGAGVAALGVVGAGVVPAAVVATGFLVVVVAGPGVVAAAAFLVVVVPGGVVVVLVVVIAGFAVVVVVPTASYASIGRFSDGCLRPCWFTLKYGRTPDFRGCPFFKTNLKPKIFSLQYLGQGGLGQGLTVSTNDPGV